MGLVSCFVVKHDLICLYVVSEIAEICYVYEDLIIAEYHMLCRLGDSLVIIAIFMSLASLADDMWMA